jgi:predicted pyridoxine 5'-phosphate oxidase superfamily flavin-nucleotide-binding protein
MADTYHDGQRQLQDRFDTRRLADKLYEKFVRPVLSPKQQTFIASCDMLFLATADDQGRPTCTYRGGDPGFVRCVDDGRALAIPNYDGDGKYLSWGNVVRNPHVGLLFMDFMKGWRLRVHGDAAIMHDDPLLAECPGAQFIVRVAVREAFGNCPRYIHKYQLVERSPYVPHDGSEPPVPDWKKVPDLNQVLPKRDPARDAVG